jgi:SNF family Na+-dependent transporter
MGVGVGVVLLVVGAVMFWAIEIDIPGVTDDTLGVILMVVGVLAIILALVMNAQRANTKHVEERRYDGPPPR